MIAISADPNDPEDFDVSESGVEQAITERRVRMRGAQKALRKQLVSIRLDPDIITRFKAGGPGWQSRINEALRKAI